MADYVLLDGVRTWYEKRGDGDPLVLLHPGGAGVDVRAFGPNLGPLAAQFCVYTPERRAHGHTPDMPGPITFDAMAQDTIAFMETVVGRRAHVVGSSDGAIVGLLVALRRPDLIDRLVLVAGVFHFSGWLPHVIDPNNQPPEFLARLYEEVSQDGAGHYQVVVDKLARMHLEEPALEADDLGEVRSRTLVMVGDDDEVRLEHALAIYRGIPDAELMVVPGTSHGLLVEKPDLCSDVILAFLIDDPVPTMAPIRRKASS
ncbi:MAG: alpha/beta hydrolase [Solirubrobacterales bacterium]|nr:alpha/beta hydrolase [Solirubrobacterales bacterium]